MIVAKLSKLSDSEMRDIDKNVVQNVVNELKQFAQLALDENEVYQICETTQILLSLKFIKSPFIQKKLTGV
jgi:hypothetical protein